MKAIIFDFDGVIHNTFDVNFKLYKEKNPTGSKEEYLSWFDGNIFANSDKKFSKKDSEEFDKKLSQEFEHLKLKDDIRKHLEVLNENYDLYIITSNSIKNLKTFFRNNNFQNIFKEILSQETHKSKIEKFKILFEKYQLNKESSVFVTDTLGDILEANKVGVKSIAVNFGYHKNERLVKGKPIKIVSSFEDIEKVIQNI